MEVCPSMPLPTIVSLVSTINRLSFFYKYFQIDIGDGIFVSNRTVQISDIIKHCQEFKNLSSLTFDFHLMVKDYVSDIEKINQLERLVKIKNVFIHFGAVDDFSHELDKLSSIPIGLTLNPEDQVSDLADKMNLDKIPCLQIMSVVPGVQGNPFIEKTLIKIEQLRHLGYRNKIYLDGAVNNKTMPIINSLRYKPDVVCPGSFLVKSPDNDLKNRVDYLLKFK